MYCSFPFRDKSLRAGIVPNLCHTLCEQCVHKRELWQCLCSAHTEFFFIFLKDKPHAFEWFLSYILYTSVYGFFFEHCLWTSSFLVVNNLLRNVFSQGPFSRTDNVLTLVWVMVSPGNQVHTKVRKYCVVST